MKNLPMKQSSRLPIWIFFVLGQIVIGVSSFHFHVGYTPTLPPINSLYHTQKFIQTQSCTRHNLSAKNAEFYTSTKEVETNQGLPYSKFIDPNTGCEVILVGCLHGSSSSAQEVKDILYQEKTDIVVLELCATRFRDVRRSMEIISQTNPNNSETNNEGKPGWKSYVNMVYKTTQKLGVPSGIAAALLGGFSNMQTALSGFEPGLEFIQAIQYTDETEGSSIILADQDVGETLKRLGDIPKTSIALFLSILGMESTRGENINLSSVPQYGRSLFCAVCGYDHLSEQNQSYQVNMGKVLIRDSSALKDLMQITMTPLIAISILIFGMNIMRAGDMGIWEYLGLVDFLEDPLEVILSDISFLLSVPFSIEDVLWETLNSIVVLLLGFVFVAIPVGKVIIHERDDQLAQGVAAACNEIAMNQKKNDSDHNESNEKPIGRVVAVLGLLHVNGVTKRLLEDVDN